MKREGCPTGFDMVRGQCVLKAPDQWTAFNTRRNLNNKGHSCGVQHRAGNIVVVCDKEGFDVKEKTPLETADVYLKKIYNSISYRHSGRDAFRILIDLLADQEGLTETKYEEYKALEPLLRVYRSQARKHPKDYLGELVTTESLGSHSLCQNFTPTGVTNMMAAMTLGDPDELRKQVTKQRRPISMLEPAMGTGAMMIAANNYVPDDIPFVMYGVELDPMMYQAALVNMSIMAKHPYQLICADSLALDPSSGRAWAEANKWNPPDMSKYYVGRR